MKRNRSLPVTIGLVCGCAVAIAFAGCDTYGQSPRYSEAPRTEFAAYVEIRTADDFYEPLSPYGHWEIVGAYGRCWIPDRVGADWGPYEDGYWRLTDDGWYWESTEPWGWATYHYGRWDSDPRYGWFWVPQTRWGPAWVSWRHGGGYTGWAPMGPAGRAVERHDRRGGHGGYVFVEDRQFLEPVRHQTVVVNTTIINRTVVNERPSTSVIEKASGRKVQVAPSRDLRRNAEAAVRTKRAQPEAAEAKREPASVRPAALKAAPKSEAPRVKNAPPAHVAPRPAVVRREAIRPVAERHVATPVSRAPSPAVEVRATTQTAVQPAPVAEKPQVKAKSAGRSKTKPTAKSTPASRRGNPEESDGRRPNGEENLEAQEKRGDPK